MSRSWAQLHAQNHPFLVLSVILPLANHLSAQVAGDIAVTTAAVDTFAIRPVSVARTDYGDVLATSTLYRAPHPIKQFPVPETPPSTVPLPYLKVTCLVHTHCILVHTPVGLPAA